MGSLRAKLVLVSGYSLSLLSSSILLVQVCKAQVFENVFAGVTKIFKTANTKSTAYGYVLSDVEVGE